MATYDLTNLADVKAWLGVSSSGADALLSSLVTQTSRVILNSLNRGSLLPFTYNDVRDGQGGARLLLKNWPVISVNSLAINGVAIPASAVWAAGTTLQAGYVIDAIDDPTPPGDMQQLSLVGYRFTRGIQNVVLSYTAGYQVSAETQTIPGAPYQVVAMQPYGAWASDRGVAYASGSSLVAVVGVPTAGQYSVSNGVYTFSAADSGRSVALSYGFVPSDLALACKMWVAEIYSYTSRIGVHSKTLGGQETISYDTAAIPSRVAQMLQNYRRVVPL